MTTVDAAGIALAPIGLALIALGWWLRQDPAAKWARVTGDES